MHQPYPQGPSTHTHQHPQYSHNGTYSPNPYHPPPPRMMNGSPGPVYYHQAHSPTTYSYAPPLHPPPPQYASPHTPPPPTVPGTYLAHTLTHSHGQPHAHPPHAHPPHTHYPPPQHRFINGQPQYLPRHHLPASARFPPTPPSVQSLSPYSKPILLPAHSSPGLQPTAPVFQPQHLLHPPLPSPLLHQLAPPSKAIQIVKPPSPTPPPQIVSHPTETVQVEPEATPTSVPQSLPQDAEPSPHPSPALSQTLSLLQTPQQQALSIPTSPTLENTPLPGPDYSISIRPVRPEDALGLTISPLACPPSHILLSARPGPSSPIPRQAKAPRQRTQLRNPSRKTAVFTTVVEQDELPTTKTSSSLSGNKTTSFSTTDTTPTTSTAQTPTPGSPLSSNTSVSLPMTPVSLKGERVDHSPSEVPPAPTSTETTTIPDPSSTPTPAPSTPILDVTKTELPSPAADKPKTAPPPPLRKSFASLLRSSEQSSSTSGSVTSPSSSRTGFAASAQQGVSIPGSSSSTPLSPGSRPRTSLGLQELLTTPSLPLEGAPQIRPRGLVNTGNMCFANSVLQVLIYSPPFWKLFTELGSVIGAGPVAGSQRDRDGNRATPLTDATVAFLKEFTPPIASGLLSPRAKSKLPMRDNQSMEDDADGANEVRDSFVPSSVYAAMKEKKRFDSMRSGHQEDAEEFLGFYLDTLHEELLSLLSSKPQQSKPPEEETLEESASVSSAGGGGEGWMEIGKKNRMIVTRTTKSVDSPITRIFTGKYRSVLRMPGGKDSATVEDLRPMQLDIQPSTISTVEDALQHFTHPDIVHMPSSTSGAPPHEVTKQAFVEALPPILVLHLKRFIYDSDRGGAGKVGKRIGFGPELEIRNDIITPARRAPHPPKYKLYGVIYHHGHSASGGHYTIDVLHPNPRGPDRPGEGWIRIDDEVVTHLTPQDVFGKKVPPAGGVDDGMDRSAYLLFYRRVTTGPGPPPAAQASR